MEDTLVNIDIWFLLFWGEKWRGQRVNLIIIFILLNTFFVLSTSTNELSNVIFYKNKYNHWKQ